MLNAIMVRLGVEKRLKQIKATVETEAEKLGVTEEAFRSAVANCLTALERSSARKKSRATKIGMAKAKKSGTTLGRPAIEVSARKILAFASQGLTLREMADHLGCGVSTAQRLRKEAGL